MQGKHSRTPGNWPNLTPGEFGVNLADRVFFMRSGGKKIRVPMEAVAVQSGPPAGTVGAPMISTGADYALDDSRVPVNSVNGRIRSDPPPPPGGYGLPSRVIEPAADAVLGAQQMLIEPFYVASDDFVLRRIAFCSIGETEGVVRMGLAALGGAKMMTTQFVSPPEGVHALNANLPLAKGWWMLFLWSEGDLPLKQVRTLRHNQGFDLVNGMPAFVSRRLGTPADYSQIEPITIAITQRETSPEPGEPRAMMMQWTLG